MGYIRLHITAEGQTEEAFVKRLLQGYLAGNNVFADVRLVFTGKESKSGRLHRGGLSKYGKVKEDILSWTKQDRNRECRFTTMFNLYGLPEDFPGIDRIAGIKDPYKKVAHLEKCLAEDIGDHRFIPYLQLHEFEALLFSRPDAFLLEYLEHEDQIRRLEGILQCFDGNPELIDDGIETAPSKRISACIPEYMKVASGPIIAREIGLEGIREQCPHFDSWLSCLESLAEK